MFSNDNVDAHILSEGQSFGVQLGATYNSENRKNLVFMSGGTIENPEPHVHEAPRIAYDEKEEAAAITLPLYTIKIK